MGTIAYGKELFRLLQEYHAIVVPSLSEDQPRIVYDDAYSQVVPILASNTDGLRDCIHNHKTGVIVTALPDVMRYSSSN
ncbi:hypothetical protein [Microcoleus sp. Pol7_A1]|uniref:hypothetical protein n=1 Tax=Microcoleus sp. Pol7_A1 TaxID=2818893 RepID=UPI002FD4FCB0